MSEDEEKEKKQFLLRNAFNASVVYNMEALGHLVIFPQNTIHEVLI